MSDPSYALRRLMQDAALRSLRAENAALAKRLEEAERENRVLRDKAIRFDLDVVGIAQREAEAVELVELRAENEALRKDAKRLDAVARWGRWDAGSGGGPNWRANLWLVGPSFHSAIDAAIAAEGNDARS